MSRTLNPPNGSPEENTMADATADPRAYGDTHDERARELTETGKSVRRTGKGALADLRDALNPEAERLAREQNAD